MKWDEPSGTAEERVAKGAAMLDKRTPGWAERLPRLSRLSIGSANNCVLGQLYDCYSDGRRILGMSFLDCERYGFIEWRRGHVLPLTRAWRQFIRDRRSQAGSSAAGDES